MVQNYTKIMNKPTFWLYFFYFTKKKLVEDTEFPCGKLSLKLCGFINICKSSKQSYMNYFTNDFYSMSSNAML